MYFKDLIERASLQNSRPDQLFSADYPALDKQLVTRNVGQNYYL